MRETVGIRPPPVPARITATVASTGTSAAGPGNSRAPSIRKPHDRIAASPATARTDRTRPGNATRATTTASSAPAIGSHNRANVS